MNFSEVIRERIRALRKASGMSQTALAEKIGVHMMTVQAWESGRQAIGVDSIERLSECYGIKPWELCTPAEELKKRYVCTIEESFVRVMEYTKEKILEDLQRSGRQPKFDLFNNSITK